MVYGVSIGFSLVNHPAIGVSHLWNPHSCKPSWTNNGRACCASFAGGWFPCHACRAPHPRRGFWGGNTGRLGFFMGNIWGFPYMEVPQELDCLSKGKSQTKMDDLWVLPFMESIWILGKIYEPYVEIEHFQKSSCGFHPLILGFSHGFFRAKITLTCGDDWVIASVEIIWQLRIFSWDNKLIKFLDRAWRLEPKSMDSFWDIATMYSTNVFSNGERHGYVIICNSLYFCIP